ncbi:Hpt domain-containing protein [Govanella unica]|uniref:Hpt domain-containing protein n=1 Tax=Govanella unica TaxID=2975056 RepID=A0A9X3TX29_9PROT|nr:Hpt domain-containing protein [Govania unica]MDA5193194.1 Hpt domain-containing protein [Govania unica]
MTADVEIPRFDTRLVEEFARGDAVFMAELIDLFLTNAEDYVTEYLAATEEGQQRDVLHKLKGAALTVGAERLAALCNAADAERGTALVAELAALNSHLRP